MTVVKKEGESRSPIWVFFDKGKKWDTLMLQYKKRNSIWCTAKFYSRDYKITKFYAFCSSWKKCEEWIKIILL